ncbi:hypothetical protein BDK51DRAFT_51847 [Blyttiomyces helicus]|uniref:Uncharacterized protein n=1 Tax=Blyttiomyces helicus TaxID=388810 RepID=A0A4P9WB67_9FUNG|nr:hypothetical protein BDK51DRAFT_51847 [Blyttiomyces helicus]|eukprot:RKO88783.1 hypothetical protein BDK51DRAFT_51847 [Blyttiomyces helicus]
MKEKRREDSVPRGRGGVGTSWQRDGGVSRNSRIINVASGDAPHCLSQCQAPDQTLSWKKLPLPFSTTRDQLVAKYAPWLSSNVGPWFGSEKIHVAGAGPDGGPSNTANSPPSPDWDEGGARGPLVIATLSQTRACRRSNGLLAKSQGRRDSSASEDDLLLKIVERNSVSTTSATPIHSMRDPDANLPYLSSARSKGLHPQPKTQSRSPRYRNRGYDEDGEDELSLDLDYGDADEEHGDASGPTRPDPAVATVDPNTTVALGAGAAPSEPPHSLISCTWKYVPVSSSRPRHFHSRVIPTEGSDGLMVDRTAPGRLLPRGSENGGEPPNGGGPERRQHFTEGSETLFLDSSQPVLETMVAGEDGSQLARHLWASNQQHITSYDPLGPRQSTP